ncbi:acyl-CoA dehydrogenase family protein [Streptomyces cellulosae]|uniref:hypothetical protein n=1 Tax=Streptomyces cellulosae TaxID=1968 RepID=UPI0004C9D89D|nr:hypothetical protein [Streptomyces cellulosae]
MPPRCDGGTVGELVQAGLGGTRSSALSNPLQRVWRDLEVASRHGLNNTLMSRGEYALSLLGMD